jgi:glucose/arabinose dehydrogenase
MNELDRRCLSSAHRRPQLLLIVIGLLVFVARMDAPAQSSPPQTPQGPPFKLQNAFGNLVFTEPVALRTPPGETNRLFVVQQNGLIYVLTNMAAPVRTLFLNLSQKVLFQGSESLPGLTTMAFHPGYATNGLFFVGYNLQLAGQLYYRVSRFSVSPVNPNLAVTTNELPLITQLYTGGDAQCDDMLFGLDGYLYIGVADQFAESGGSPQRIDQGLFSGVLRIDVDQRPGSVAPNPGAMVTTNYAIPPDNPFIGATNFNGAPVDPAKVRTEFYAVGLKRAWRMACDQAMGLLYAGDPGANVQDEVAVIVKGGNYGWPYREGTAPGPQAIQTPKGLAVINPIYQIPKHAAVIGGVVYYGQRFPQLQGAFIFGDWLNGPMRALRYAGTNMVPAQLLASEVGIAAFGTDPSNGDVLPVNYNTGVIRRLVGTNLPLLTATPSLKSVTVSWPSASGFVLQQNSNLAASAGWTRSSYTISTANGTNSITVAPPTGNLFFRLANP